MSGKKEKQTEGKVSPPHIRLDVYVLDVYTVDV